MHMKPTLTPRHVYIYKHKQVNTLRLLISRWWLHNYGVATIIAKPLLLQHYHRHYKKLYNYYYYYCSTSPTHELEHSETRYLTKRITRIGEEGGVALPATEGLNVHRLQQHLTERKTTKGANDWPNLSQQAETGG